MMGTVYEGLCDLGFGLCDLVYVDLCDSSDMQI